MNAFLRKVATVCVAFLLCASMGTIAFANDLPIYSEWAKAEVSAAENVPKEHVDAAIGELAVISAELRDLSPVHVIWDIEDLSKQPPWGNDISEDITDLSNYFVTSDGEDFLTILLHALEKAKDVNEDVNIESM